MIRSLNTAASGMEAQQLHIDVIANNLANVNTVGFKRSRAEFQDMFYQEVRAAQAGGPGGGSRGTPAPLEVGQGVRVMATQKMFTVGALLQTNNSLDFAIEGQGFFALSSPDGARNFTRAGNLRADADGMLVNMEGLPLDPPVLIPPDAVSVTVERDGTVKVIQPGDTEAVEVGRIELASFVNPAGLKSMGHGMFSMTEASGEEIVGTPGEDGLGHIAQGMLESSNVKVVDEMIELIAAQRAYEVNSRVVRAADEMLRETTSLR